MEVKHGQEATGREHITTLLDRLNQGDSEASADLLPRIYDELHALAAQVFASQERGHTLQATALLHEAFLRMLGNDRRNEDWRGRHHSFAVAARAMRRVLIDHARRARAAKRDRLQVTLSEDASVGGEDYDLVELGEAFEELAKVNERVARVVELRLLGGLKFDEVVEVSGVSRRTVGFDWRAGRAWLRSRFGEREEA